MASDAEEVMNRIGAMTVGVHFTREQADKLKRLIEMKTDTRSECPCQACRRVYS